ncbi:inactive serine/threonine-protein kinase PLK5-like [Rhea pennata]|uniref:inactive serine/threonine-protein kinase PLK5-like n=1 Tax=Rhea pennata TaxID=8795 RepID=UPI002E256D07
MLRRLGGAPTAEPAMARRRTRDQLPGGYIADAGSGTLYKRGRLLGQGAFGRCYELMDVSSSKVYAVKIIPQARLAEPGNRQRVEREIELHGRLRHRHVVGFHGHFADRSNVYVVLEYCSRRTLADILRVRDTLTEPEVRYYLRQIISGLRYLHGQGIVHRDLKPSNLFVTTSMQVKIGDMGLARREGPSGRRWGAVCGTPGFLAPEVVDRRGHSAASDVWALGCIMYAALAGSSPFEGASRQELYRRIRAARLPLPGSLSPGARALVASLLAPEPAARPGLGDVLRHDFFTQGFTPDTLPARACRSAPVFARPNLLCQVLRRAAAALLGGCQQPPNSGPRPSLPSPAGTRGHRTAEAVAGAVQEGVPGHPDFRDRN